MNGKSSLTFFNYIREINKLPSDILSHAKFKILIEIAMQIFEHGKSTIKNKEISIKTALNYKSIKVLISQLKHDGWITIEKIDGLRTINLCDPANLKRLITINQIMEVENQG